MEDQTPKTKAELLPRIERGKAALDTLIRSVPDQMLVTPGADGWSIKDHLAHLASWQTSLAALLRCEPRYEAMGLDLEFVERSGIDEMNARIDAQNKKLSLDEVRARLESSYHAVLDALSALSDDDLRKTYSHYQPDEPGTDSGAPITGWIAGNTYEHYEEHMEWIRALLGRPLCES